MARIRTHPGEVLREEFMKPLGLSANALALALWVSATRICGRRSRGR
jgi:addiction module HigA family antidote